MTRLLLLFFLFTSILYKTSEGYVDKTGTVEENKALSGDDIFEVEAQGYAQITESGEQDAYDRALDHAFRVAVEQALGSVIRSSTLVEDSVLKKDEIIAQSRGFVKKYHILADYNQGNTKRVKIKAWVVKDNIKQDAIALGIIQDRVGRLTLVVAIDEKKMNGRQMETTKKLIHEFFREKEFRLIDVPNLSQENLKSEKKLSDLALKKGAEMLLIGTLSSKENRSSVTSDTKSVRSSLEVKLIYAGNAQVITSQVARSAGIAFELQEAQINSIERVLEEINPKIFVALTEHWNKILNDGAEYEVLVYGISFAESKKIKDAITSKIAGVKKVFVKEQRENYVRYLIRYTGLSSQLVDMLTLTGKTEISLSSIGFDAKTIKLKRKL